MSGERRAFDYALHFIDSRSDRRNILVTAPILTGRFMLCIEVSDGTIGKIYYDGQNVDGAAAAVCGLLIPNSDYTIQLQKESTDEILITWSHGCNGCRNDDIGVLRSILMSMQVNHRERNVMRNNF